MACLAGRWYNTPNEHCLNLPKKKEGPVANVEQGCIFQNLDHVGIAVTDLEAALRFYRETFGVEPGPIIESQEQGLRASTISVGQSKLEILQPLRDDTPVGRFIKSRGEGLHHIGFRVDNIHDKLRLVKSKGVKMVDQEPRPGLYGTIGFLHPDATRGVLIELTQPRD